MHAFDVETALGWPRVFGANSEKCGIVQLLKTCFAFDRMSFAGVRKKEADK